MIIILSLLSLIKAIWLYGLWSKSVGVGGVYGVDGYPLGTGDDTKTDEFSEKFPSGEGGVVIFNPENCVADFGLLHSAIWAWY